MLETIQINPTPDVGNLIIHHVIMKLLDNMIKRL